MELYIKPFLTLLMFKFNPASSLFSYFKITNLLYQNREHFSCFNFRVHAYIKISQVLL